VHRVQGMALCRNEPIEAREGWLRGRSARGEAVEAVGAYEEFSEHYGCALLAACLDLHVADIAPGTARSQPRPLPRRRGHVRWVQDHAGRAVERQMRSRLQDDGASIAERRPGSNLAGRARRRNCSDGGCTGINQPRLPFVSSSMPPSVHS